MRNTITIDNVPEGYELTGEFRTPNMGEMYFWHPSRTAEKCVGMYCAPSPILRKLEPPKPPDGCESAWTPRGAWMET